MSGQLGRPDAHLLVERRLAYWSARAEHLVVQDGQPLRHVQLERYRRLHILATLGQTDGHYASTRSTPSHSPCRYHPVHPLSQFRTLGFIRGNFFF